MTLYRVLPMMCVDSNIWDWFTGFWHDYNCGFEHKSICKRRASPPANTTVAPTVPPKGGCPTNWKKLNSKVRGHFYLLYMYCFEDMGKKVVERLHY